MPTVQARLTATTCNLTRTANLLAAGQVSHRDGIGTTCRRVALTTSQARRRDDTPQTSAASAERPQDASGFLQRRPSKRVKSLSFEYTVPACSIAYVAM